jgi:hypothetical protein
MAQEIHLLDVVALTCDVSEQGLVAGQVGTVVEILDDGFYEVEFSNNEGETYAMMAANSDQLLVLHHERVGTGQS